MREGTTQIMMKYRLPMTTTNMTAYRQWAIITHFFYLPRINSNGYMQHCVFRIKLLCSTLNQLNMGKNYISMGNFKKKTIYKNYITSKHKIYYYNFWKQLTLILLLIFKLPEYFLVAIISARSSGTVVHNHLVLKRAGK